MCVSVGTMSFDPITYGGGPPKEQLWKVNDRKAQKNGMNRAIFGVKTHVIKDTIKRRNVKAMEKTWDIGNIYQGEWKNNQKHGYGIQVWAVGNKYEGDWANGLCEGHGIFWVKHKEELRKVYAGNWKGQWFVMLHLFAHRCCLLMYCVFFFLPYP